MDSQPGIKLDDARNASRKVFWRLLPLLMICYVLAYIDRQNVGFAKLQFMADLGFSDAAFGLAGGLFYLGYSLFEVPSNLLLKRIGARATLLRIMVAWGICATVFAWMQTELHFYLLRFLLGAAEAGFFPGILLFISYWVPQAQRASFTAVFMAAMPFSGVIGAPISGLIMQQMDGLGGMAGWQWMFIVQGVPSIVMGIAIYFLLSDRPRDAAWLTDAEKAALEAQLASEEREKTASKGAHHDFRAAFLSPRFYGLAGMSVSLLACIAGLSLWMPTLIRNGGVTSLSVLGLYAALPPLLSIVAQQLNARHSDRVGERRWHAAVPVLIAALGFVCLPMVEGNLFATMACLIVVSCGLMSATGPYWTLPSSQLSQSAAAGGIALITTVGGIGSFAAASIVGEIIERTGQQSAGFYFYAGLALLGPIIMLVATRPQVATKTVAAA